MPTARMVMAATVWFAIGGIAPATDRPIAATKLQIRRTASGKQRLVFSSKDPAFLFPLPGSSDAPNQAGLTVELFSAAEPAGATLSAPALGVSPGWSVGAGSTPSFRFARAATFAAASPIRRATLQRSRVLSLTADAAGLALTGPQGGVGIRIQTGTLRSCARFDGAAVTADRAGQFAGRNATIATLTDCSNAVLAGAAPACGDGEINGTEECDGAAGGTCATNGFSCRSPGVAGECGCCSNGGPFTQVVGCCDPTALLIPMPPASGGLCIPTRCDQGLPGCSGDECQPDGSCCTSNGAACSLSIGGATFPLNACCPGQVCARPIESGLACCVPDGGWCTLDAECCGQRCGAGGVCGP